MKHASDLQMTWSDRVATHVTSRTVIAEERLSGFIAVAILAGATTMSMCVDIGTARASAVSANPFQASDGEPGLVQPVTTPAEHAEFLFAVQNSNSSTFEETRDRAFATIPTMSPVDADVIQQAFNAREEQLVAALKQRIAAQVRDLPVAVSSLDVLRDLEAQYKAMSPALYKKSKEPLDNRWYQIARPIQQPYALQIQYMVEDIINGKTDISEIDKVMDEPRAVHPDLYNWWMRSEVKYWKGIATVSKNQ